MIKRHPRLVLLIIILALLFAVSALQGWATSHGEATQGITEVAIVKKMSVREKVGQLFMPTITGTTPSAGAALIKRYHLGGVIYFTLNLRTPKQTATLSNGLQKAAMKDLSVSPPIGDGQAGPDVLGASRGVETASNAPQARSDFAGWVPQATDTSLASAGSVDGPAVVPSALP